MALLGAEVIKIEQPGEGDQLRKLICSDEMRARGLSPSYLMCNINKRGITLDLKAEAAKEIITRLIKECDVVLENFKAGQMDRLGFGYEFAKSIRPDIIYCSISGYGQTGPKAGVAAYDGAIQAASGMMNVNGHPETGPTRAAFFPVDMSTGLTAALAISGALYRRRETGEGQRLDVAMLDSALTLQASRVVSHTVEGEEAELTGNEPVVRMPSVNVFATADGFIQTAAVQEAQIKALFDTIGHGELMADPRYFYRNGLIEHSVYLHGVIAAALTTDSAVNWVAKLEAAKVPVAKINRYSDVVADEQMAHRNIFVDVDGPPSLGGSQKLITAAYMANQDGPAVRHPAPDLGQHTDEVLGELGFTEAEIAGFHDRGAV
ncbi:MAG: CoA transferase [Rhodospirillaceae bacterium]|nr:CoA transferase [Rhodospirillaceae bacterium]MBT4487542.1 CoA transferase [Rhodospirillaceae bacterium]MBT5899128.1 CoA transferase [Rhodospirillaceae bacterium]MBT6427959.1 CoA transferase [Rhodospirillaceae bacterium]